MNVRRIVMRFLAIPLVSIIVAILFWCHAVSVHGQGRDAYMHSRQQSFDRIYAVDPRAWSIRFYLYDFLAAVVYVASIIVVYELISFGADKLIALSQSKKDRDLTKR
jgi:hypothetical protein